MWDVGTVLGRALDILKENVGIVLLGFGLTFFANFVVQMPATVLEHAFPLLVREMDADIVPAAMAIFAVLRCFRVFWRFWDSWFESILVLGSVDCCFT